ncbi:penicillin-binding protein activator [Thiomicrorhabdus sediminis]|uniref:Uncharacterized protein n=1 Tax=Thiomicrorhabdus sediminis TaxID=2580412 RepID=A0A4V1HHX1_9GAMM|nr:hypothetical protein [Thiomicrorhabdus sediminis]QCU90503.1 hypothetical protein FE785_07580 [Thiomicrorhabdus sediminis]
MNNRVVTGENLPRRAQLEVAHRSFVAWLSVIGIFSAIVFMAIPVKAQVFADLAQPMQLAQAGQIHRSPQHVNRLDQEILILRAEMAKRRGEWPQLKHYLSILEKQPILPEFAPRVEQLKHFKPEQSPLDKILSFFGVSDTPSLPLHDRNAVVAIVLPLSGAYASAGEPLQRAIQEGLTEAGFTGKLVSIDSELYDSVYDIWNTLKYYEPSFIFGPLQKEMVANWQLLDTGVTTFYFNEVLRLGSKEFALAPSKLVGLEQLFQIINDNAYQHVMVISDKSDQAQLLKNSFAQAWKDLNRPFYLESHTIDGNVGRTLDKAFDMQASKDRALWVEHSLNRHLSFEKRARRDIDLVVSFVDQHQAIQVSPYLNYLPIPAMYTHVWYPSQMPNLNYLLNNLDAMSQTLAILPFYLAENRVLKQQHSEQELKIGLFYALGRVATEIVKKSDLSSSVDSLVNTEFGSYVRNAQGQFHLLPMVYWADQASIQRLSALSR